MQQHASQIWGWKPDTWTQEHMLKDWLYCWQHEIAGALSKRKWKAVGYGLLLLALLFLPQPHSLFSVLPLQYVQLLLWL